MIAAVNTISVNTDGLIDGQCLAGTKKLSHLTWERFHL